MKSLSLSQKHYLAFANELESSRNEVESIILLKELSDIRQSTIMVQSTINKMLEFFKIGGNLYSPFESVHLKLF